MLKAPICAVNKSCTAGRQPGTGSERRSKVGLERGHFKLPGFQAPDRFHGRFGAGDGGVLLVTSSTPKESKTSVAAGLARQAALGPPVAGDRFTVCAAMTATAESSCEMD